MLSHRSDRQICNTLPIFVTRKEEAKDVVQFICFMKDGWYIENTRGEEGPFASLREAEAFVAANPQIK